MSTNKKVYGYYPAGEDYRPVKVDSNGKIVISMESVPAHATNHQDGGADEISLTGLSGESITPQPPKTHATTHQNGGSDEISVAGLSGELADNQPPKTHATTHQNGGSDEISVAGLSGELADNQPPKTHHTNHENGGSDEISVAGLSGELADNQPPKAHNTSHQSGGSDAIKLDDLSAPDDNTDLDASVSLHGLLKKGSNIATDFLNGKLVWTSLADIVKYADYRYLLISAARNIAGADASVSYHNYGFKPTAIIALGIISGSATPVCFGFSDAWSYNYCIYLDNASVWRVNTSYFLYFIT